MNAWPFYISLVVVPGCFVLAALYGGPFLWLTPVVVFVGIPLGDLILGHDTTDPEPAPPGRRMAFDLALWLWVPVQLAMIGLGLWRVTQGVSFGEGLALALSLSLVTVGGGINVAHELMHRKPKFEQGLSELLMTSVSYPWFCVEHILGHHRHVATAEDPATARLGQTVYAFVPQSMIGGLISAWRLEGERVARKSIPAFSWADRRLRHAVWLVATYVLVGVLAGPAGILLFAAQSFFAVSLLEVINYVEHYGLEREEGADGRPVRVQPHHSWNSTYRFTNWYLFNLQRHADHHAYASRPYHQLRAFTDAPELPYGYPTMILAALVPPLWFAIMNPRVAKVRAETAAALTPA